MEKRRPHYALSIIKAAFVDVRSLRITRTALGCAQALGITLAQVVMIIQGIKKEQLYKSMTSNANSTVWQDVYHVPYGALVLYVKFTIDAQGYLVISFKER